jgi:hypothetical protein
MSALQTNDRLFSERTLAIYDGSVAERPIFIAVRLYALSQVAYR